MKLIICLSGIILYSILMFSTISPPTKTLYKTEGNHILYWESFPVTVYADQTSKKHLETIKKEIKHLNDELGFTAIVIHPELLPPVDFTQPQSLNTITFGSNKERGLKFKKGEQGVTSISWSSRKGITQAHLKFNVDQMDNLDFPTLFRHELGHFLGMKHDQINNDHIMNEHLPLLTERPWGSSLHEWKEDMRMLGHLPSTDRFASTGK